MHKTNPGKTSAEALWQLEHKDNSLVRKTETPATPTFEQTH